MDLTIVSNALNLTVQLSIPVVAAALVAAVVVGLFQVATQISDDVFGFVGRLAGVGLVLYLMSSYFSSEVVEFTSRIWGGGDYYF